MLDFLICLIISVLLTYGMAITLVEKGREFPVRKFRILLKKFIHDKISRKFSKVLDCSACSSFYLALLSDILICIISLCFGYFYFLWPFSGFLSLAFTWTVIELLNGIDKEQNINVLLDNQGEENEN